MSHHLITQLVSLAEDGRARQVEAGIVSRLTDCVPQISGRIAGPRSGVRAPLLAWAIRDLDRSL